MTTGSPTSEVVAIVERLNSATNWMRQGAGDWKSVINTYDRAPFEAATLLQSLEARVEWLEGALELASYRCDLLVKDATDGLRPEQAEIYRHWRDDIRAALTPSNRDRT